VTKKDIPVTDFDQIPYGSFVDPKPWAAPPFVPASPFAPAPPVPPRPYDMPPRPYDVPPAARREDILVFPIETVGPGATLAVQLSIDMLTKLTRFYCEPVSGSLLVTGLRLGPRWLVDPSTRGGMGIERLRDEQVGRIEWPTLMPGQQVELHVTSPWRKRRVPLVAGFWGLRCA
jgi:hypothetical protein